MDSLKQKILGAVRDDLEAIEVALTSNMTPYLDLVSQTANHILSSGGKRLRPLLMVLCARLCGYGGSYDTTFSTIFEYLHTASLLHDDVVDGATLRRGKPVAHSQWGSSTAILVGDFLFARALSIAAETRRLKIIKAIATITEDMSQGELHQLLVKGKTDLSETEYLEVIRRKTAVLIEGACLAGALISDAPRKEERALSEYGLNIGMAFQMADDLLDYTSDSHTLGKEIGADLKEGKLTLPVIQALAEADGKDRARMEEIIGGDGFSDTDFGVLVGLLGKYGGPEYARRMASEHVSAAKDALSVFKSSRTREILLDIADYTLVREA